MGNFEARFVDQSIAEQHDIQIQRARAPAFKALAALVVLDGLQRIEQVQWREATVECGDGVGIARLARQ